MKIFLLLTFICLSISCNVVKVVGGGDTEISDDFFNNDPGNCSTCNTPSPISCPIGYIVVPGSSTHGTSDFCVAQYEMKNVGAVATSQAGSTPWVSITPGSAKTECQNLGANYDIISNNEWMTISYEIENNSANWSGGTVGTGMINRGHSDNTPASALSVTNSSDPYDSTGNNSGEGAGSGWEQKRVHYLTNGYQIWDFGGNVAEWVDWINSGGYDLGPTTCTASWLELNSVSCGALASADYLPNNSSYTSTEGFGQFFGGTGGAVRRGGFWSETNKAGIYALNFQSTSSTSATTLGFRCVYRP